MSGWHLDRYCEGIRSHSVRRGTKNWIPRSVEHGVLLGVHAKGAAFPHGHRRRGVVLDGVPVVER